ncbi:MAG: hypothetical protein Q7V12_05740, partial [Deltaproteobacteria bacterium]|nr:hypothetical protein [Deltaproteobacteria bacterium]
MKKEVPWGRMKKGSENGQFLLIKGGPSKWVHDTFVGLQKFAWQEGYGAFSVNVSLLEDTIRYIEGQGEHH